MDHDEAMGLAETLLNARRERRTLTPVSDGRVMTMDDAYEVQRALTTLRVRNGERIVGWKLGYTSAAMREQMGVAQPNLGPLLNTMLLADGATIGAEVTQPKVEPEIAIRLRCALAGAVSRAEILSAIDGCFACLEVVDSVFTDYRFTIEDNTADGSSAALVVLGDSVGAGESLDRVSVRLERNSALVASSFGSAASGHPLNSVAWLVSELHKIGRGLEVGDIVITGGLTAAVPLEPGDEVRAIFDDSIPVRVSRRSLVDRPG